MKSDLKGEWDKHKGEVQEILSEVKSWAEELHLTIEINTGVTKLTLEAHFDKPPHFKPSPYAAEKDPRA